MTTDRYSALCKRIQRYCLARAYYGPDGGWMNYQNDFDSDGQHQTRIIAHDPHTGFEFPPATEEQLQVTEEALDIPLPPMLRALYSQVANGGFGPACGITGAHGGYSFGEDGRYETIDAYTDSDPSVQYFDLRAYERGNDDPVYFELRETRRPAHFLHLCYLGCSNDVFLEGKSGRIYSVGSCGDMPESFLPNEIIPGTFRPEALIGYTLIAADLEDWLEQWLSGRPHT